MVPIWRHWRELRERVAQAHQEKEQARERLRKAQEEVVKPLRHAAEHNQFAALIRESLMNGDR